MVDVVKKKKWADMTVEEKAAAMARYRERKHKRLNHKIKTLSSLWDDEFTQSHTTTASSDNKLSMNNIFTMNSLAYSKNNLLSKTSLN